MGGLRIDGSVVEAKWWCYFGLVILAGILIRAVLSGLREWELRYRPTDDVEASRPKAKPVLPDGFCTSWRKGFLCTGPRLLASVLPRISGIERISIFHCYGKLEGYRRMDCSENRSAMEAVD
jgi:hypothetical protein